MHQHYSNHLGECGRLKGTFHGFAVKIRIQMSLQTPTALDLENGFVVDVNILSFYNRLPNDDKTTANKTVRMLLFDGLSSTTIVDLDGNPFRSKFPILEFWTHLPNVANGDRCH